jgi:hypothetical protein
MESVETARLGEPMSLDESVVEDAPYMTPVLAI